LNQRVAILTQEHLFAIVVFHYPHTIMVKLRTHLA
jgi:hypothetical protein